MQMAFPPRHPPDATFLAHLVVPRVCGDAPDAHAGRVREVVAILAEHGWARYDNGTALWFYTLRAGPEQTVVDAAARAIARVYALESFRSCDAYGRLSLTVMRPGAGGVTLAYE